MQINKSFSLLMVIWLSVQLSILSGCSHRMAAWVTNNSHPNYPAKNYIIGIGQGQDVKSADQNAIAQLKANVQKSIEHIHRAQQTTNSRPNSSCLDLNNSLYKGDPDYETIALRWSHPNHEQHASLAVLDKNKLGKLTAAKIEQTINSFFEQKAAADKSKQGHQPILALQGYLKALASYLRLHDQMLLLALVSSSPAFEQSNDFRTSCVPTLTRKKPSKRDPSPAGGRGECLEKHFLLVRVGTHKGQNIDLHQAADESCQAIDKIISSIKIRAVGGIDQKVKEDHSLDDPLVAAVAYDHNDNSVILKDVPISFSWPSPTGNKTNTRLSNAFGLAVVQVDHLVASLDHPNQIIASLDGQKLLKDSGLDCQSPAWAPLLAGFEEKTKTVFPYRHPSQNAYRIAVYLAETTSGQTPTASTIILEQLKKRLPQKDFELIDVSVLYSKLGLPFETSPQEAWALIKDKSDLLVFGWVDAKVNKFIGNSFVSSKASGTVQLVSQDNQLEMEETTKGSGNDHFSADRRALINFSRKITTKIKEISNE
jgi:hypothetical protein